MSLQPEPAKRIGDAERDDAVSLLQEHMAAGRLDTAEFNDRVHDALQARTMGDLENLFTDLPGRRPAMAPLPHDLPATAPREGLSTERRRQLATAVSGALWIATVLVCFMVGWNYWWLLFIPMLSSGVVAALFGISDKEQKPDPPEVERGPSGHGLH